MAITSSLDSQHASFERLVAPWRDDVYRYVFWLCKDPDLADDVVQDTLIRAFRSVHTLKDDKAVKGWLLTIARREHARVYERKRLETSDIDDLSQAEAALIATETDSDVEDMRMALLQLEDEYREPLVLQVMMGFSTAEIAEMMQLTQAAVLTRLHRARKKLMDQVCAGLQITGATK